MATRIVRRARRDRRGGGGDATGPPPPPPKRAKLEEVDTCEQLCRHLEQLAHDTLQRARSSSAAGGGAGAGSLLLLRLREANWAAHFELEERKEHTRQAKAKLDSLNLQLQNLLYEKAHYLKEIQHCRDFRPREVVADLLPPPPDAEAVLQPSDDEETRAHRLMTSRLAAEQAERKRLCKEVEALSARKAALLEANQSKRKFLHGLRGRLQQIAQASEPAQQYFGYTSTERVEPFDTVGQLPASLYTLFAQLSAHKQAFDTEIGVSVAGEIDAAVSFNAQYIRRGPTAVTKAAERIDVDKRQLFTVHPLAVLLHFPNGEDIAQGVALKLRFEYLPELNIVGVRVDHGDESLLFNLYPKDLGLTSPNPANCYLLPPDSSIRDGYPGRTFKWAQWAAGLAFVQEERTVSSRPHVASIIQRIKARIRDHRSLNTQLNLLAKGVIPGLSHAALHSWKETSAAEFQAAQLIGTTGGGGLEEGEVGARSGIAKEASLASRHFYTVLKKADFELEAFARVGMEYPQLPPEWKLRWRTYAGKRGWGPYTTPPSISAEAHPTALAAVAKSVPCDNQLLALEMRLNSTWDTKHGEDSMLLSHQCLALQMGFERLVDAGRPTPARVRPPIHGRARLVSLA